MGIDPNNDDIDLSTLDRGDAADLDADTPPADTPPAVETPPADTPPAVETPPVETPASAPKKDHMIPKARLDEEIRKRREMEARLKALEEKLAPPAETPPDPATVKGTEEWFDAQESAYMDAVLDGKPDEAKRIRREIRAAELGKAEEIATTKATKAAREVEIVDEFNAVAEELESAFPVFNPEHEEFDDGMAKAVLAVQASIMQKSPKTTPGTALKEAAARLGYKLGEAAPAPAPSEDDDPPAKPPAKPAAKPPVQPPRGGGGESRTPTPAPARLTESALARMSEEDRARLRGDFL